MFTGIVEETGTIKNVNKVSDGFSLVISAGETLDGTKIGDSIAVNGVCLTVTSMTENTFSADVMNETMDRSSLNDAKTGSSVNLERAMAADGRFGGHIVSGHIDGMGTITNIRKDGNALWFHISASKDIMKYIIEKGSVALDGISLTVAGLLENSFSVSVIPHTMENTCLLGKKENDVVNIENDCIGKYVEKLMLGEGSPAGAQDGGRQKSEITEGFLLENGFR